MCNNDDPGFFKPIYYSPDPPKDPGVLVFIIVLIQAKDPGRNVYIIFLIHPSNINFKVDLGQ